MGRYYFDIEDGPSGRDEEGTTVANARDLQSMAVEMLGQILQDKGASFWKNPNLRLSVRDERNKIHLRLTVCGSSVSAVDSDHLGDLANALREIEAANDPNS